MVKVKLNKKGVLCGIQTLDNDGNIIETETTMDFDDTDGLEWYETEREVVSEGGLLYFKDEMKLVKLQEAKQVKLAELSSLYTSETTTCDVSVKLSTGKSIVLNVGTETQQVLQMALTMVNNGLSYTFVCDNGDVVEFTNASDVVACLSAINAHNTACAKKWGEFKTAIEKAKTVKALDKIVLDFHAATETDGEHAHE